MAFSSLRIGSLAEVLAAVLKAVLAASWRWCCWRCWCRLAADAGGSSSLRTRFVISKFRNSGSKFGPTKYQYSGVKERGRRYVGLSWYTKLRNIHLRLHLWFSPFISPAQYCWHSLIYKWEITRSLLRSEKWTQKVTPNFDYVVNYTTTANRDQKLVRKMDVKSDLNFQQIY